MFGTQQTVVLMNSAHESAGGEQQPDIYDNFLKAFDFLAHLNPFTVFPGLHCIADTGHMFQLLASTICFESFGLICVVQWRRRKRLKKRHVERPMKRFVWVSKLLL